MSNNVKVTVGLCVKNSETTVKDAVQSILNQDFPLGLMELIVVDGCSKDKTLSTIEDILSRAELKRHIFQEDSGLGHARQIVVDKAAGDYIVWVDGDLLLERDFVRNHVQFMDRNPSVGIAVGRHRSNSDANLIATLENVEDFVDFSDEGAVDSKPLGTGGSIYRIEALRQVGGFDLSFKGAGEDMDVEKRIRAAGWSLCVSSEARFCERRRATWKALWNEYFWYGYGGHYAFYKDRQLISYQKMLPPLSLWMEVVLSVTAYKLTHKKVFFLLPFHYVYKRIAWLLGFLKGHLDGYKPQSAKNIGMALPRSGRAE